MFQLCKCTQQDSKQVSKAQETNQVTSLVSTGESEYNETANRGIKWCCGADKWFTYDSLLCKGNPTTLQYAAASCLVLTFSCTYIQGCLAHFLGFICWVWLRMFRKLKQKNVATLVQKCFYPDVTHVLIKYTRLSSPNVHGFKGKLCTKRESRGQGYFLKAICTFKCAVAMAHA